MNSIPEESGHHRESHTDYLISFADKYFASGLVTAIVFDFTHLNLDGSYEVQLFNRPGWKREAHVAIQAHLDACQICTGGRLLIDIFGPSTHFVFPAYRTAIIRASKFHIRRYLELGKEAAKLGAHAQVAINKELENYIEGGCR